MPTCSILQMKWKLFAAAAILGAALPPGIASSAPVVPPPRPVASELVKIQPGEPEEVREKREKKVHVTKKARGLSNNNNAQDNAASPRGMSPK